MDEVWDFARQAPVVAYDFHQPTRFSLVSLYE